MNKKPTADKIVVQVKCPMCLEDFGLGFTILQLQRLIQQKKNELKEAQQYRKIRR